MLPPQNEKGGIRRKLANAASSIYLIAIRKRRQEDSKKKARTIPKMGKITQPKYCGSTVLSMTLNL
jgi:hypothetical protein